MKIAILTPRADYSAEWGWAYDIEAGVLTSAGAEVFPISWTDRIEPEPFDLVLPLVAWGYHQHFDQWLDVLDRLEAERVCVQNPVPLLRWNSDKRYLAELCKSDVPTVPTVIAEALDEAAIDEARRQFATAMLVVKPLVSASAYRTFRLGPDDGVPEPVRGRKMMVQPWIESIRETGEWSLIYFDGKFSHAVSKVPRPGEFRVTPEHGGIIAPCEPPVGAEDIAMAALAAAPAPTLYARVDLVAGNCGSLQVMELELIEPAFFMAEAPHSGHAFAQAVLSAAERAREQPLADC